MSVMTSQLQLEELGRSMLQSLDQHYSISESKLYAERPDRKQPAFNWGVGVMLSALNSASRLDPKFKPRLREYADATRAYWNQGGYDVLPTPKPLDRYYDDNAWMALALVETYEVLGDKKYLDWATGALDFALQGEAKNGGIYWRDSDRASRNTCSNAPTAAACLSIYKHTKERRLLDKARELYAWTKKHLQDPADGLYWDNLTNNGKLDKTKWTYNTALMIRTAVELRTIDPTYADQGDIDRMISSSRARWFSTKKFDDVGRFAHLLLEAWIIAGKRDPAYSAALIDLAQKRSKKGWVPPHWGKSDTDENPEILDQAGYARACLFLVLKSR